VPLAPPGSSEEEVLIASRLAVPGLSRKNCRGRRPGPCSAGRLVTYVEAKPWPSSGCWCPRGRSGSSSEVRRSARCIQKMRSRTNPGSRKPTRIGHRQRPVPGGVGGPFSGEARSSPEGRGGVHRELVGVGQLHHAGQGPKPPTRIVIGGSVLSPKIAVAWAKRSRAGPEGARSSGQRRAGSSSGKPMQNHGG